MELRHLEQILEICRAGGFSGAARKLQISQPTLSKSIARLEAQLSLKLFERSNGAARPTAYGAFVAQRAEALLQGVSALSRDLEQLARGEEGKIRIAVGPASRLKPLPELLRRIAVRFPKLHVETIQETGPGVMTTLQDGRVDIAFGYSEHAARYGDLIRKKMFEDQVIMVARPGHPALALRDGGPRDVLRHPCAIPNVLPGIVQWGGELSREEAENLRAFSSDDYALIIQRALDTDTIAIGAAFLFDREIAAGRLQRISCTLDMPYACWMLTTAERWRSPLVKAMAELSKAAVTERPATAAA
ncbi:LysR family transcriptional regulator [Phenylobacterium sp.]|uniref:LysR family transcriptional regulator n=1 Tax=Phenylobacterium sp. TaxID=1871053 RepID=UPI0025DAD6C4|nr:LysR family transcriptional regulator [Phenylobacterium sp.]MBX3484680.1 LysR family transcriptional regulator [Phenylobacterium sp.]MCW5761076.1 LysR family transcriptional regulator [Phenylobacterium sp.]